MKGSALSVAAALCAAVSWTCMPSHSAAEAPGPRSHDAAQGRLQALDLAFRIASAIDPDPKDKAKAQEGVVMDFVLLGALDEAERRADRIDGWRRGVVYADLATARAKGGEIQKARALVEKAQAVRGSIQGWENPRIAAHVAQALAALGDVDRVRELAAELAAEDRQYAGMSPATMASAHAARGEPGKAKEILGPLDSETDFEVAWWRTAGYLAVARESENPSARLESLKDARRSAEHIPGWKKAEALESVAEEFRLAGDRESARSALVVAEQVVLAEPATMPLKPALLSNLARAWGKLEDADRGRRLLATASKEASNAQDIERPGVYANIASSYHALGERDEARRLLALAVGASETLVNARPRALAAVQILRVMARGSVPMDATLRSRMEALLAGLKSPW